MRPRDRLVPERQHVPAALSPSMAAPDQQQLAFLSAIALRGPDTEQFLEGQLTISVAALAEGRWTWGGYCSPKGRLLSVFFAWRPEPDYMVLAMAADLTTVIAKRLRMYIMRAQTELTEPNLVFSGALAAPAGAPAAGLVQTQADGSFFARLGRRHDPPGQSL